MMRLAVIGASGFIGSACVTEARRLGIHVDTVPAPRLLYDGSLSAPELLGEARSAASVLPATVVKVLRGSDVVVNAAGVADAVSRNREVLLGANTLLPITLASLLGQVSTPFLHVSSAAVQGDIATLDETQDMRPFSPYSESKSAAEAVLFSHFPTSTVYRPTSVHGATREVTRTLVKFARSPMSSVAGSGHWPTPQVLVDNVASGILYVARAPRPPRVVLHPSEQLSCFDLLRLLGGRRPRTVPIAVAKSLIRVGKRAERGRPLARRLEMVWFGQDQERGWLDDEGWRPPLGREGWFTLGRSLDAVPGTVSDD